MTTTVAPRAICHLLHMRSIQFSFDVEFYGEIFNQLTAGMRTALPMYAFAESYRHHIHIAADTISYMDLEPLLFATLPSRCINTQCFRQNHS